MTFVVLGTIQQQNAVFADQHVRQSSTFSPNGDFKLESGKA
jgi:hypothetical protein